MNYIINWNSFLRMWVMLLWCVCMSCYGAAGDIVWRTTTGCDDISPSGHCAIPVYVPTDTCGGPNYTIGSPDYYIVSFGKLRCEGKIRSKPSTAERKYNNDHLVRLLLKKGTDGKWCNTKCYVCDGTDDLGNVKGCE